MTFKVRRLLPYHSEALRTTKIYMYVNKTHSVEERIVRRKVRSPVGFSAKYDVSIDEKGYARLEKLSFGSLMHTISKYYFCGCHEPL